MLFFVFFNFGFLFLFFYSYSYDLTHTLQFNMAPLSKDDTKCGSSVPQAQQSQATSGMQSKTNEYPFINPEPDINPNLVLATKVFPEEEFDDSTEEQPGQVRTDPSPKPVPMTDLRDQDFAISDMNSIRITPTSALDISVQRDRDSQRGIVML